MPKIVSVEFSLSDFVYDFLVEKCEELDVSLADFFKNYAIVCYKSANE